MAKQAESEKMELVVVDFNPPGMNPEIIERLKEEGIDATDLKPDFIKMPAAGVLSYVFPKKANGKQDLRDEFSGVVLFTHECNAFWPSKNTNNTPPSCSSLDGILGFGDIGDSRGECKRNCAECPMNQYGTATGQDGQQSRGKACKNMRRLYVLTEDECNVTPKILSLPPSSLSCFTKDWRAKNIVMAGLRSYSTLVKFELEGKDMGGKEIGVAKCCIAGVVDPAIAPRLKAMQDNIKAKYQTVAITGEDYNTEQHAGQTVTVESEGPAPENYNVQDMADSM